MSEGSWVGLDVHARSVVAGVIDMGSGEVRSLRLPAGFAETVEWLKTLPAPVRVVYEAGPTGYGLARGCAEAGISCVVAAPSRIRPAADRVKTDRRDAERLARLLRLGEITAVRVPGPEEEAARDLVRAREDARGDLMRARHRLSKLLLRHGAVYEATAWDAGARCVASPESRREASRARSSWSRSRANSPGTAGHSRRSSSRHQQTARRGERTGENDARSDPRERSEQPLIGGHARRQRSAPLLNFAYPVMRHQPAHMSRDTDVDDSRCAPPAEPNPRKHGGATPVPG
jgi:transposase